ncbi:hypothetical protein [Nonomuraea sp. NPDC001023]|uniref:hypothetical protein n=1 Tax=unclassified Nonomuraea TaxID=2593643 RepID=UPI003316513B
MQADAWFTHWCAWTLAARDDVGSRLPLRLNPSAVAGADAVTFLGAAAGEPMHEIRLTPMVRACLRAVGGRPAPSAEELRELLGAAGDAPGERPSRAGLHRFVATLVQLGLLEQRLPFADQDAAPWRALSGGPEVPEEVCEAAALDRRLHPAARDGTVACRPAQRAADRVRGLLGYRDDAPARRRDELIRHDTILTGPARAFDRDAWQPVCAELNALRPWAGLAEAYLPLRLVAAAWAADAPRVLRRVNIRVASPSPAADDRTARAGT